ncbi:MAG: SDR family NAD(P)-dependent oxidoreductase [Calditrichaeota bacterium]|nr:MAG: SDR family NAD(P)-dependent oxidoreductase [Calditrichota bacterium]MBL1203825.1 SDR family NAD(P)-dependent oxidoreductase [Calditrichota bacterium]NOG43656.1 SDR family NAD(P)-dependent oxidoreductase [Calditrichota bacterium]
MPQKKALIIGCTSGIGLELTYQMIEKGYIVGGTGKREDVLIELDKEFSGHFHWCVFNSQDINTIKPTLSHMIKKMHGMDICIIAAGTIGENHNLQWAIDEKTIRTNVLGFTAIANFAAHYFLKTGSGHIVGISSLNKFFGSICHTSFNASKAFISIYLEGLRNRMEKQKIYVTEICPGFLKTPSFDGFKEMLWIIPMKRAAKQIIKAIEHKKKIAYISKRWYITGWLLRLMPSFQKRIWQ